MRKLIIILLLGWCGFAMAQSAQPLSEEESAEIEAQLTEAALSMQTLQCRFVQQKTMAMLAEPTVSEGVMVYAAPDRLRWAYEKPYPFALVVNGEQITRIVDGKSEVVDAKSGKMYQGIVSIILGSASGRNLFDRSLFEVTLFDDGTLWKAEMTPKRRDIKRMFSQLVFRFDKKTNTISQVEMKEAGGDITKIQFEDIQVNEAIQEFFFAQ